MSDTKTETPDIGRLEWAAGWALMIAMGPIHFAGEMVGPAGGTNWRQWVAAILGTYLWAGVIWMVIQYV